VIYLGIDDTDTLDTPGTNCLAREIVGRLVGRLRCVSIVRHQLFFDPRVPYTSKNGSASICFGPIEPVPLAEVIDAVRHIMQEWYVEGSDPGLAACEHVPPEVTDYALRCKTELIDQQEPRALAARHGIHLEGLGGTEGGVIGALAAVGLIATENDGRVVHWQTWPDDLTGPRPLRY
jgi:tRNA(Ile2) C34 agmatinyltransferase TiaS